MSDREATYVLITDAPPLKNGGHGCCVLAWNWLQAMGTNIRLVVTHRLLPQVELSKISNESPAPVLFYSDLARIRGARRCGWLKSLVEFGLFLLVCGRIAKAIKASSAQRIFAFFGGDPWFLAVVRMVQKQTGLPLDIYLVDDLEESCRLNRQPILARWVRWLEPKVLRQADRVFVISPGYGEHLRSKYGIAAEWLPIPFRTQQLEYRPYKQENPEVRTVVYIGAVNALYLSALKEFLEVVAQWNKKGYSFKIKVLLLSYSEPTWVERELAGFLDWELRHRVSAEERRHALERCWAVFLPYSFEESVRVMVSTSFASRLSECMTAGRPLVVYGPSHASLPRYFVANELPVCVQSRAELKAALQTIEQVDSASLIAKYQSVLNRYHSHEAIAARIFDSVNTPMRERLESV